jgi:hypothetical protein
VPTASYSQPSYTPPSISQPSYNPPSYSFEPKSSDLTGFDFLGNTNKPELPRVENTLPPFKPPVVNQPKKQVSIQEAADDFFSSLDNTPTTSLPGY